MLKFRNDIDRWIYKNIRDNDEYHLDHFNVRGSIILDIGMHAGYFAHTVLSKGAAYLYGYEMVYNNFRLAEDNLRQFNNKSIYNKAIWRSDVVELERHYDNFPVWNGNYNTGGIGIALSDKGRYTTELVSLDNVVDKIINKHGRLDMIKIDAESSEWPILLTSTKFMNIPIIIGEYHEIGGKFDNNKINLHGFPNITYDIDFLINYLGEYGYSVTYDRYTNTNLGHFWAVK